MARAPAFRAPPLRWQLAAAALAVTLFAPLWGWLAPRSDIAVHVEQARRWAESGSTDIEVPNFLFLALVAGGRALLPWIGYDGAGIAVLLGAQVALILTLLGLVRGAWPGGPTRARGELACLLLSASLLLVMPVNLFTLPQRNLYFGYVSISTHHNPTLVLLRPLALLLFVRTLSALGPGPPARGRRVASTAALAALGALAKPNFALAFLPALAAFFGLWRLGLRRDADARLLVLGVVLPSLLVLAGQYLATYAPTAASAAPESRIVWAPLQVMRAQSPSGLAPRLALSLLFPLCVGAALGPRARRSSALQLGWLTFAAGAGLAYGFAEAGPRFQDGNFLWSAQIALFVLFGVSLLALVGAAAGPHRPRRARQLLVCGSAYALHLASGLVWYGVQGLRAVLPSAPLLKEWF